MKTIPPLSANEMKVRGIDGLDFVYISGDAYIDHPSFGTAIIARVLESRGYSVGILAQPDWHDVEAFRSLGKPRLAFLVSAGNLDSMVDHYTAAKKRRSDDAYTPGGKAGKRPDRAVIVYANRCREAFPHVPVLIGGIEASLRRFAHYDYWDDRVRHSILYDSGADLLMYGMGERSVAAIADALDAGVPVREIRDVPGTCFRVNDPSEVPDAIVLPSYAEVAADKRKYAEAFRIQFEEQDAIRGKRLVQPHEKGCLVQNPPQPPLSTEEMDAVYALPFTRRPHPSYKEPIPAIDEVKFSITSCRGCFGGCNFCALTFHQGRVISARSHESILAEAREMTKDPDFKGYIHDVGGPTANFRKPACKKQLKSGVCKNRSCIGYERCQNLEVSHEDYVALLRKLRAVPGVKKVFIRSGVRFDYLLYDKSDAFLKELCAHHVSGQLKVAPEHIADRTLYYMNKTPHALYEEFLRRYARMNERLGKKQFVVPYLMSSHPGCTLSDAVELAQYLKKTGHRPQQVQDFYPTPGTVSTCMYYTGLDPRTMEPVFVPKDPKEKAMQRALMQYFLPANFNAVRRALRLCHREDLIGTGRNALVPPERTGEAPQNPKKKGKQAKKTVDKRRRNG
ncbi:MAG: YgiQ family radical SAM protein [Clostridia bacterium]|nr:YgiQ family radical SAM protein [Clostridia bacterium]